MQKTKLITIAPITCSKGHTFYPRVSPDGTIKTPDKCMIRSCRVYLDHKRVKYGIEKRLLNLKIPHLKKIKPGEVNERPKCLICKITFFDQLNFEKHNKRLHQQK